MGRERGGRRGARVRMREVVNTRHRGEGCRRERMSEERRRKGENGEDWDNINTIQVTQDDFRNGGWMDC